MLLKTRKRAGQALSEYALILALVALIVVGGLVVLGPRISSTFNAIGSALGNPTAMPTPTKTARPVKTAKPKPTRTPKKH